MNRVTNPIKWVQTKRGTHEARRKSGNETLIVGVTSTAFPNTKHYGWKVFSLDGSVTADGQSWALKDAKKAIETYVYAADPALPAVSESPAEQTLHHHRRNGDGLNGTLMPGAWQMLAEGAIYVLADKNTKDAVRQVAIDNIRAMAEEADGR